MIAMVKRYQFGKMKYEFSRGNDICYVGRILTQTQINYLKLYGNTCINEEVLAILGKQQLIEEIEALTGLEVTLDTYESEIDGTSVIIRVVGGFPAKLIPEVTLYKNKHKDYYIVYKGDNEFMRFKKKYVTLQEIKELLKLNGVYDYEIK